ncbi:helix-turn-helix domain-containing protein [Cronobacter sakazakii]|nr:helix-turn-helix domain-containing protein [Cronobacter sakazakii]
MNDNEVKLKKSVIFKNSLPEIERMIKQGMTQKDIAENLGFKYETFKKYYARFKHKKTEPSTAIHETFSHAKNVSQKSHSESENSKCEPEFTSDLSSNAPSGSLEDIIDPDKRSASVSEFMTKRKPLGKGNKK